MCGSDYVKLDPKETYMEIIQNLLNDMKFGTVTLIVQDGKVVQIDKTEKFRIKD